MRLVTFAFVGLVAAAVHFLLAVFCVSVLGFTPQAGNAGGYIVALLVSYLGQSQLTYAFVSGRRHTFARFATVSGCGFALNSMGYALLLRWTTLDYRLSLILVLTASAAVSYLLLSNWVFAIRSGAR